MSSNETQFAGRTAALAFAARAYTYRLVLAFVFTCFILFSVVFDHSRTGIFILSLSVYLFCTDVFHRAALKDIAAGRLSLSFCWRWRLWRRGRGSGRISSSYSFSFCRFVRRYPLRARSSRASGSAAGRASASTGLPWRGLSLASCSVCPPYCFGF